ncbi:hypothetical protein [Flavobacterium taihuense]|uniref:hypothetical protein n=1 Tax=Flavobacterium taihuense TaxID=2857508 RepID=UPI0034E1B05D
MARMCLRNDSAVNYIHNNPVKDKVVTLPEDYYFSSSSNYAGLDYELEVILLDLF